VLRGATVLKATGATAATPERHPALECLRAGRERVGTRYCPCLDRLATPRQRRASQRGHSEPTGSLPQRSRRRSSKSAGYAAAHKRSCCDAGTVLDENLAQRKTSDRVALESVMKSGECRGRRF
jgi:hypothetical protein